MKQDIKAFLNLSDEEVSRLTEKELRKAVSILSSSANKRIQRLREQPYESPALLAVEKRVFKTKKGGKFGTRGKNLNQLRSEYSALQKFFGYRTSSISSWNAYRKEVYGKMGGTPRDEREFWRAYRKIEETNPTEIMEYGSDTVQKMLLEEHEENDIDDAVKQLLERFEDDIEYEDEEFFTI